MESYQTLNRELVLTVRDLRKENYDLRDLVTSLKAENMKISSEYSEFRRCALDKFSKMSEIIVTVNDDLFSDAPKKPVQAEMTKKRYSMSENSSASSNLPRSSPEKMPRKLSSSHVNVGRRRGGQKPREAEEAVPEDTDIQDMSIEDIRDWLRSEQVEISVPTIMENPVEPQPTEEVSESHEEVPENQEQINKNMTTILEENSKSFSQNSLQVTQVHKFASSTPHSNRNGATLTSRMELSPIASSNSDERCLLANGEKRERIFTKRSPEVSGETSETLQLPKTVTVRRRDKFIRDLTPEEPEEASTEKPKEPEEPTPKEEEPEEPKRKPTKKKLRKRLADRTNWTEDIPEELPMPIKVEKLDDFVPSQRPKRRAAPRNLTEPSLAEKLRRK